MFVPLLITDFLGRAIRQYGKKVGVVDEEKRFTYAQFGERVNRLSHALIHMGVRKGDRVAALEINGAASFPDLRAVFLYSREAGVRPAHTRGHRCTAHCGESHHDHKVSFCQIAHVWSHLSPPVMVNTNTALSLLAETMP